MGTRLKQRVKLPYRDTITMRMAERRNKKYTSCFQSKTPSSLHGKNFKFSGFEVMNFCTCRLWESNPKLNEKIKQSRKSRM
jgi:hypothetical protein